MMRVSINPHHTMLRFGDARRAVVQDYLAAQARGYGYDFYDSNDQEYMDASKRKSAMELIRDLETLSNRDSSAWDNDTLVARVSYHENLMMGALQRMSGKMLSASEATPLIGVDEGQLRSALYPQKLYDIVDRIQSAMYYKPSVRIWKFILELLAQAESQEPKVMEA